MHKENIDKIIQGRLDAIEDSLKTISEIVADVHAQKNLISYLMLLKNDIKITSTAPKISD